MPMRKSPCKNCQFRALKCHEHCEAYIVYAQLVRKDREAKQEYRATHDNWTVAKGQMSRRKEKYRLKKAKGVSI